MAISMCTKEDEGQRLWVGRAFAGELAMSVVIATTEGCKSKVGGSHPLSNSPPSDGERIFV